MKEMYSKKVMAEFLNPKNVGELKNPDGVGEVGNPVCGDVMRITIKVKDNKISNIKFKTFGCAAAIATTSILTKLVKGKTLSYAKKVNMQSIIKSLGGLPPIKTHCAELAIKALKKAVSNYESNKKKSK